MVESPQKLYFLWNFAILWGMFLGWTFITIILQQDQNMIFPAFHRDGVNGVATRVVWDYRSCTIQVFARACYFLGMKYNFQDALVSNRSWTLFLYLIYLKFAEFIISYKVDYWSLLVFMLLMTPQFSYCGFWLNPRVSHVLKMTQSFYSMLDLPAWITIEPLSFGDRLERFVLIWCINVYLIHLRNRLSATDSISWPNWSVAWMVLTQ